MNIIFFGSDRFAAAHLRSLIDSDHQVVACVTQPDRPKGRGMKVVISEIKECAQEHSIPLLQPNSLKEDGLIDELKSYQSDVFVVIAYGRFLPRPILDIPPKGAVNVHASLLPKYRGAAPINWAIINGEDKTGLTIMYINEEMDAGDILAQLSIAICKDDTSMSLRTQMMKEGPSLLIKTLNDLSNNKGKPIVQDHSQATFAPKLTKELGIIDWQKSADSIYNQIRGLLPWPSAYTSYNGKLLKILEAQVVPGNSDSSKPGTVVKVSKDGIMIAAADHNLLVKKVHLQDAKPMDASAFVRGHAVAAGYKFH